MPSVKWLCLIVVLLLTACRLPARGGQETPIPDATFPVGRQAIEPGDYTLQLGNQDDLRDVIIHIPPAYDGTAMLPLVIVLHGGGGSGSQVQRQADLDPYADEYGFVAVYPNGSGRLEDAVLTWNSGHCCGYALTNRVDDVGFLSLLIDSMLSHYAIDPDMVYLTGLSNGAMMAYRGGAELADKVAGIAPIAGTIGGQVGGIGPQIFPDTPSEPVSVIAFHGMQDSHVLYDGGVGADQIDVGRADLSVVSSISFWVKANGCDATPETVTQANGNIIIETYGGCEAGTQVVLVTIVDGLHAWPGGHRALVDEPTQDISASEMMLQFFLEHPKID